MSSRSAPSHREVLSLAATAQKEGTPESAPPGSPGRAPSYGHRCRWSRPWGPQVMNATFFPASSRAQMSSAIFP